MGLFGCLHANLSNLLKSSNFSKIKSHTTQSKNEIKRNFWTNSENETWFLCKNRYPMHMENQNQATFQNTEPLSLKIAIVQTAKAIYPLTEVQFRRRFRTIRIKWSCWGNEVRRSFLCTGTGMWSLIETFRTTGWGIIMGFK